MGIIQRQGIKNTIITYVGIFLGFLSLLIIQPYFLKPEEIGLTRVLFSFSFLLSTIAGLGIGNITIRFFPHFKNYEKGHHGFLGFVLIFPIVGLLFISLGLLLFATPLKSLYAEKSALFNTYYYFAIPFAFFIATFTALTNYSYALFKSTVPTLLNDVAQRALFIVLIFIYSFGYISLDVFIACFVAIHFLLLIALSIYILKEDKPSLKIDPAYFKKSMLLGMLGFGAVFLFATTASMGIKLLDSVVLGQFITLDLVGVYAIAAFIPTFIEAPANALEKIALPKIADSMVKNDYVEIKKIYALSSRFLFALGALLFLLVNANIRDLLSFLPEIYQQGADVVIILSLSALFNLITGSNNALVFNSDRFYVGVVFLITIALCTLVMLYLFIPEAGLIGAAWAICISSILYNLFKFLFILIKYKIQPFGFYTLITLVVLLALFFAEKMISLNFHPLLNILMKSSLISGLFLLITFYFGVIDKKLFKLFKK